MAQPSFGMILRDARERQAIDLNTAARKLRIRPDIISAIEESDFSHMPPRGYTRNMVNAYARFLGLNPTEITRMYLDDCYAYQVGRSRTSTRSSGFSLPDDDTSKRKKGSSRKSQRHEAVQRGGAFGRDLYVDDPNRDRRNIQAEREHLSTQGRPQRNSAVPMQGARYTNFYSGPKAPSPIRSKLPFVIAGIIILVLLVIVLVLLFGPHSSSSDENVPNVPVSGLSDPEASSSSEGTEGEDEGAAQQEQTAKTPPTKTVVKYTVDSGVSVWIDITQDGTTVLGQLVDGPAEQEFDVTGTLTFRSGFYPGVKLYQDGVEIPLADHSSSGAPVVTIDFNEVLAQWQQENAQTTDTTATGTQ